MKENRPYRIILADDHILLRQGLKRILSEMPNLQVVGEAGDGLGLLKILKKEIPDMVIMDISMPNLRGIEATREVKISRPKIKILILTMHRDKEYLEQAMRVGADGYLLKESADKELFRAIEKIREGKIYISPFFSPEMAADWLQLQKGRGPEGNDPLTHREKEILKLVAEGKTNREISCLLTISIRTVENHRANLMKKLSLKKTPDLVKYALRHGYA
jgi:DNA-binding NarL/FixJ family response regulator